MRIRPIFAGRNGWIYPPSKNHGSRWEGFQVLGDPPIVLFHCWNEGVVSLRLGGNEKEGPRGHFGGLQELHGLVSFRRLSGLFGPLVLDA